MGFRLSHSQWYTHTHSHTIRHRISICQFEQTHALFPNIFYTLATFTLNSHSYAHRVIFSYEIERDIRGLRTKIANELSPKSEEIFQMTHNYSYDNDGRFGGLIQINQQVSFHQVSYLDNFGKRTEKKRCASCRNQKNDGRRKRLKFTYQLTPDECWRLFRWTCNCSNWSKWKQLFWSVRTHEFETKYSSIEM